MIHPKAYVDSSATVDESAEIMPYAYVGPNVTIGRKCILKPYAVIEQNTKIGEGNVVHCHAVLGGDPQDVGYRAEPTFLEIGNYNTFREHVTVHRGSHKQDKITRIGHHNFVMASAHIGHDCIVGDHNIFTNYVALSGHVTVDHHAVFSGYVGVQQFCHIGAYAFLGRAALITMDVLPYVMVTGSDAKVTGLNRVKFRHSKEPTKLFIVRDF